jgi:ATP-dependent DNA helicase 2 subunit 2
VAAAYAGDMMRKSIVFNKKTPDVFYCPQRKPTGFDKMIVQARPLNKLCEHGGNGLPPDYKSDCYNDVDESEYACKEKYRIMVSRSQDLPQLIASYNKFYSSVYNADRSKGTIFTNE